MKQLLLFVIFLVFFKATECGLISQSSIQSCDWGDSNEPTAKDGGSCKEKFVVSMTLKSGQGEMEALYANVHQVQTSRDSEPSSLEKPFRIEIQKSQTITNYRVYYRDSVNGLPHEDTRIFSRPSHCHDGWYEKQPSCNKQRSLDNSGEFAWDSQGFCCRCSAYTREIRRPNGTCYGGIAEWFKHVGASGYTIHGGKKTTFGSSAHCMRMNDLWYDVYDIELPNMLYNITVRLLQYEGRIVDKEKGTTMANWTTISTFYLSPSKTMGRSADGKVVVELQGDLVGANGPLDFSAKKLLIPTLKVWKLDQNPTPPPAYTNGPSDWLLVDDSLVDLSGKQCNKVGVSYTGFKRQNSPCDKPEHSCFTNQPLQLWKHDEELRKIGKPGRYMVHNFGKIHPSTHVTDHSFILRFINTDLHNTFVTFRIDAADIVFVYNVAKGRIVDAYATKFTAVKEVGQLFVEVENTGQLESEYSVILSKCLGRQSTPSKVVSILPGRIANMSFSLQSYKTKGETSLCEVQLFDKSFNLLGTSKVDVSVEGACFCFGECGCTCGSGIKGSVGNSTALPCPTPPPVIVSKRNLAMDIFFLILESIGIHGIVGFFGGILLFLGCIKLCCGGILCCRKTKAQEHYDSMIKKGVDPKSPTLVKCTGECRGAKAALARYKRKIERLKKIGKDPGILDDWRNTSYECGCKDELADIRFAYIIKALCFYYYCFILPFVWLGKKIWWGVFKDTAAKKEAAERAVVNAAKKKGKMEKYGIIDIEAELQNIEKERIELRGETGSTGLKGDSTVATQATVVQPTGNLHTGNFTGDNSLAQSKNSKLKKTSKREKLETNAQSIAKKKGKSGTSSENKHEPEKGREVKKAANTHGRSAANYKAETNVDKKQQKKSPLSLPNDDQISGPQRGVKKAPNTPGMSAANSKAESDVDKKQQRKSPLSLPDDDQISGPQRGVKKAPNTPGMSAANSKTESDVDKKQQRKSPLSLPDDDQISDLQREANKDANTPGRSAANHKAESDVDKEQQRKSPLSLPNDNQISGPQTISQQHSQEKGVRVEDASHRMKSDISAKHVDHRSSHVSVASLHTFGEQGIQSEEQGVQSFSEELTEALVNPSHYSGDQLTSNLSSDNQAGIAMSKSNLNLEKKSSSKMSSKGSRSASSSHQSTESSSKHSTVDSAKSGSTKFSSTSTKSSSSITDSTNSSFSSIGSTKSKSTNTESTKSDSERQLSSATRGSSDTESSDSIRSKSTKTESTKSDTECSSEESSSSIMESHGSSDSGSHSGSRSTNIMYTESTTSSSEQPEEEFQSSSISESHGSSESDSESHSGLTSGHSSESITHSESEHEGSSSDKESSESSHTTSSKSQSSSSLQS